MSGATWMGRPLEKMSKTELIEAVMSLAAQLKEYHALSSEIAIGKAEKLRRGN